jgi:hypothetical protein
MRTDLNIYDIVYHTGNMDIIRLFESKFKMIEQRKDTFYHIITTCYQFDNYNEEYIKYLTSRNPDCLKPETIDKLIMNCAISNVYNLHWTNTRNLMHFFKIIYSLSEYNQKTWDNVVSALKARSPSRNGKKMLLVGLINGYIKDLDLGFIKGFNLNINDFKRIIDKKIDFNNECNYYGYIYQNKNNCKKHEDIHGLYLFEEDFKLKYPNLSESELHGKIPVLARNAYITMSKATCIKRKKEIMDYLESKKQ